ncbi:MULTISPECIES: restriction endonuclease [Flavobacterium]|jgi:Holliday junction resolvase-like predicted endonuclease|uniref:Restriction endonuclease n=1 Tax=Flavobacterium luminosum TaxID=2949086 RepID=A0ABT0TRH9_9FLAO|nr:MULTISPECIES: restriction endonuclease [unclassified Flavobacterium]MCL9810010.1 restriction endonuclease [Flavobacterium sp. HXWNR70]MCU4189920.1 restriction endonuclease [Flavobacterium sp. HXWNR29]MDD3005230.1 restriction endonuclease [Flavobacterium sp.]
MKQKPIFIKKNSIDVEPFSTQKLEHSLQRSGASKEDIENIISKIQPEIYDGISSNEIYKKAFAYLKKSNRTSASRYSLKRAIFELGPTGYPFERLVAALLREKGFNTTVSVILNGECVTHEIDVLAEKEGSVYAIECKFHSDSKVFSNVKIPLYINSRFLDIQKQWNTNPKNTTHLKQGWLVTNTRFTIDAINYAKCVGLTLLSWDYPSKNGIKENIDTYGLYPITTLTTLTLKEKHQLIENDIVLVKELYKTSYLLKKIGISEIRIKRVLDEITHLCKI